MNFITNYIDYINEGVRDKMTPKSEEDIMNSLQSMSQEGLDKLLIKSIHGKDLNRIQTLINAGANPNSLNGASPLLHAVTGSITSKPSLEVIKLLLDNGADPILRGARSGVTPLAHAKHWNPGPIVDLLEEYVKTNESVRDQMTGRSESEVLKGIKNLPKWKKYDAIVEYEMTDHFTKEELEEYFNERPPAEIFKSAIKIRDFKSMNKALINDPNVIMYAVHELYGSARRGDIEMVKFLIDNGIDINQEGSTALQLSTIDGKTDMVKLLLKSGAKPTSNILEIALNKQDYKPEIVDLLIKYATPNEIKGIQRWGYNYRGKIRPKDAYPYLGESLRDKMTPKSESQGLEEFKKLDKSDMVNTLYSECIEMFDPNPPMDSTPVITDSFCDFLKKEVGFDIWKTFLPKFRKHINYDMVLDDLTKEQLIKLFRLIYERKLNESLRDKMTPISQDDLFDKLDKQLSELYVDCENEGWNVVISPLKNFTMRKPKLCLIVIFSGFKVLIYNYHLEYSEKTGKRKIYAEFYSKDSIKHTVFEITRFNELKEKIESFKNE